MLVASIPTTTMKCGAPRCMMVDGYGLDPWVSVVTITGDPARRAASISAHVLPRVRSNESPKRRDAMSTSCAVLVADPL
jgi:hypothetical protein